MLPIRNPRTRKSIRPPIAAYVAAYALSALLVASIHFAAAERVAAFWA